jgi:hypothetical protein
VTEQKRSDLPFPDDEQKPGSDFKYWADREPEEVASEIIDRVSEFRTAVEQTGLGTLWRRAYGAYYGLDPTGLFHRSSAVTAGGEDNELLFVKINDFRNILRHILIAAIRDEAIPEPRATNDDAQSQESCEIARDVLQYETRAKNLDENFDEAAEWALLCAEAWNITTWDSTIGEKVRVKSDPLTGEPTLHPKTQEPLFEMSGDFKVTTYGPMDVIRDLRRKDVQWIITRDWVNRFDLIAQFPEYETEIKGLKTRSGYGDSLDVYGWGVSSVLAQQADDVPVYTLLHPSSKALPLGRIVRCCENIDIVLADDSFPYERLHAQRLPMAEMLGRGHGYTDMVDLLGIQEAEDAIASSMVSTEDLAGVQNWFAPTGSEIEPGMLPGGGKLNVYNPNPDAFDKGKPSLQERPAIAESSLRLYELLVAAAERISGQNATARGSPEANIKAGNFAALMQAQASEFMSGFQKNCKKHKQNVYMDIVCVLRTFGASSKRVMDIIGTEGVLGMKSYTGDQLSGVSSVLVDVGNPLMGTTSGRLQLAENYAAKGWITRDQYTEMLLTGRATPAFKRVAAEQKLLAWENAALRRGIAVPVRPGDNHELHIAEHEEVAMYPASRMDPALMANLDKHNFEHKQFLAQKLMAKAQAAEVLQHKEAPPAEPGAPPPSSTSNGHAAKADKPGAQNEVHGVKTPNKAKPPAAAETREEDSQ